jgi:hypothetical protein
MLSISMIFNQQSLYLLFVGGNLQRSLLAASRSCLTRARGQVRATCPSYSLLIAKLACARASYFDANLDEAMILQLSLPNVRL